MVWGGMYRTVSGEKELMRSLQGGDLGWESQAGTFPQPGINHQQCRDQEECGLCRHGDLGSVCICGCGQESVCCVH